VPGKNIKPLNGKLLINYTIESATASRLLNKIIISTDSSNIAASAVSTIIEVPYLRPAELAQDTTPTVDVIKHALDFYDAKGEHFDNICLLQPTCPFRTPGFVDECISRFLASGADCLVSVKKVPHEYNPHWTFKPDEKGFLKIATGEANIISSRQMLPAAFVRDGSVYVFKADNIRNLNSIYGQTITYLESGGLWNVNIDTSEDWLKAEMVARMLSVA
jgi:CMP-N,N'-diacetyllegionaminic acid synthase